MQPVELSKGGAARAGWLPGASPLIAISDCVAVVRDGATGTARFDRVLQNPRGYRWDAPGARIRFRTDSLSVAVHLLFSASHIGPARNSVGFYRIDGRGEPAWFFTRREEGDLPANERLILELPVPAAAVAQLRDYELILPYGDSLELAGIAVSSEARWVKPVPRPHTRWVAFGDSVTQGFTASSVLRTYPFLVGESLGMEVINAGFGGRGAEAADGEFLAAFDAEIFTVAIGVNDWQAGVPLEQFREHFIGLLDALCRGRPDAEIYVLTPLWVSSSWVPVTAAYPLEDYRATIRAVVADLAKATGGRLTVIEGPALIDHDELFFDAVAVHPNDRGFAQMAERLAAALKR